METSKFLTVGRREQFEQPISQVNPEEAFGKAIPLSDFMNMAMSIIVHVKSPGMTLMIPHKLLPTEWPITLSVFSKLHKLASNIVADGAGGPNYRRRVFQIALSPSCDQ